MAARRIRIAVGMLAALLILIGVWAALRQHARPTAGASMSSSVKDQAWDGAAKPAAASSKAAKGSSLWVRPAAEVASRNHRRSGFAWIMRQLGASESQLDRLTGGDAVGLVKELKEKAQAGDPTSIQVLGQLSFLNCRSGRTFGAYKLAQIVDVQVSSLAQADKDWFKSTVNDDIAYDRELHAVCDQLIDTNEVRSWVKARAIQGDGASLWLLTESGEDAVDRTSRLRGAAAAGFPQAQYDLALLIDQGDEGAAGTGASRLQSMELLNRASGTIPASKGELAQCEYFGECPGIAIDIDAAIVNAREAAQAGDINALLRIGPHLPAGQMDPDEVGAWRLINASLLNQGCGGPVFTVRQMQNITGTLNAKTITPEARALAEQYWSNYGAQMMANLGCSP
jgi:hypothetical protein